ncbi:MAG: phospholipid:lipid A palmitoyltransferase [Burkholderiales bacterium]
MRHVLVVILMVPTFAFAVDCGMLTDFLASPCRKSIAAWNEGKNELYLSGYAYHDRHTYAADRIRELNEHAWGLGFARSVEDADGDTHAIYALVFRDSHFKFQKVAGYQWQTYWRISDGWKAGAGLSVFLFSRSDVANNFPLPFALPAVSLRYRQVALYGTFIPKVSRNPGGNGNVGYIFGGVQF